MPDSPLVIWIPESPAPKFAIVTTLRGELTMAINSSTGVLPATSKTPLS